jgi:hypothetical protein
MKTLTPKAACDVRGFISAKAAIVLALIVGGTGVLAYEWIHVRPPVKEHHVSVAAPKHHHKKDGKDKLGSN